VPGIAKLRNKTQQAFKFERAASANASVARQD